MKAIVHLIDTPGPGGAESVYLKLVLGLDAHRFRSVATVPDPGVGRGQRTPVRGWIHDALATHGIEPAMVRTTRSADLPYLASLVRLLRVTRADLVHCHLLTSSLYGSIAGRIMGVPVVATFHGSGDIPARRIVTPLKASILNRCVDQIVYVSDHLRRAMTVSRGLRTSKTSVVHNGIDCDRFRPSPNALLRQRLRCNADTVLIGAVGNVRGPKGYDVLLESAALLVARGIPVRVVIAGEDGGEPELTKALLTQRAQLGLNDVATFVGFQPDPAAFLNGLDVFVLPSRSEGFSLATVEAMACGLAVVATRCGGPEEIVGDGESGLLVSPGNPAALADAIGRVAADANLRASLARHGRARATAQFSIGEMVRGYERIYDGLLHRAS